MLYQRAASGHKGMRNAGIVLNSIALVHLSKLSGLKGRQEVTFNGKIKPKSLDANAAIDRRYLVSK